jgi:hypothetical protein
MFSTAKRLATIVWQEGRIPQLWAFATGVAAFSGKINEWTGLKMAEFLPPWFPNPAWWWGLVVLALWVSFSLARLVLRYETPALELEVVKDERDNSFWLWIRNVGNKTLNDCAVDFERIENAAGKPVFPHSIGLLRDGALSNPFPLRAGQPKQGRFAELKNGKITLWGMSARRQIVEIPLEEDKYVVTVGAYSEAEGAQCKKTLTLSRKDGDLSIS